MFLLGLVFFNSNQSLEETETITGEVLHYSNVNNQTLLNIVISQGERLSIQRDMILRAEREYHRAEGDDDEDLSALVTCFRTNVGPNPAINEAIKAEKIAMTKNSCWKGTPGWIVAFLEFIAPFSIFVLDVVTDIALTVKVAHLW